MPTPATPWERIVSDAMQACVTAFGEGAGRVAIQHVGASASYVVDGIFEAQTEQVDPDTGALVLSHQPVFSVALAQLQQPPDMGDVVWIRGTRYRVVEPLFDGHGTVTLRLHEA